jgi:hypothetical protein
VLQQEQTRNDSINLNICKYSFFGIDSGWNISTIQLLVS